MCSTLVGSFVLICLLVVVVPVPVVVVVAVIPCAVALLLHPLVRPNPDLLLNCTCGRTSSYLCGGLMLSFSASLLCNENNGPVA